MVSVSGITGGLDIEGLVRQFRSVEIIPRRSLEARQATLEGRKSALTELSSKLSALYTVANSFTDILTDVFAVKRGATSDSDLLTATATSAANLGSHTIEINRLASADIRASSQYTATDSDFTALADQSFDILVRHPIDGDENNLVAVTVTVSAATLDLTNEEVMAGIAEAINSAMSAAISAGDIEVTERVTANAVAEESDTTRLLLRSGLSGETNALQFTDTDGLLDTLKVTRNGTLTSNLGGFVTVATDLDAELVMDGLTFVRPTNTVDDILDGVTLTLAGTTTQAESFTISADTAAVKAKLQEFIDAYNGVITFMRGRTTGSGAFRGDATFSLVAFDLRNMISAQVTGASSAQFDRLLDIGLAVKRDGTLFFDDASLFESALATDTSLVSELFDSSDGVAANLKEYLNNYTRASGVISGTKQSIDVALRFQSDRIDTFNDRLESRVERFRLEMIKLQTVLAQVQQQSAFFSSISSRLGF
ncbi:MAG: flagellar filament capping protein FliD [Candidatus Marinimicrobia bacterium]|nr:flagellar filament capping protein FliD [Candidatus Neomarinimicrobiota bacterium]